MERSTEIIETLILNSEINSTSLTNTTDNLHVAAENDNIENVKILLDKGADVNAKDEYGRTPLYNAIAYNKIENIELLVTHGAEINVKCKMDLSPLHEAIKHGRLQIVEYLLKKGANVDYACVLCGNVNHYSPLHFATKYNNEKAVTILLNYGANINIRGINGITPLHLATDSGFEDIVLLFLSRGVDIDSDTNDNLTALHIAIKKEHKSIVKILLEHGAKVDNPDTFGKSTLNFAVETGCSMIVLDVLNYYPDIYSAKNIAALKAAVCRQGEEYKKIVEALLEYGFRIRDEDIELFFAAIRGGHLKVVEILLQNRRNVYYLLNCRTEQNRTPLHTAAIHQQEEIGKLLISYEANVNARDNIRKTPIFYAIKNTDVKFTKLLLTNGANIKYNSELLINAVKKNCLEIVQVLMPYDVNVNAVDEIGLTALHHTASRIVGKPFECLTNKNSIINTKADIAKLLLWKGANVQAKTDEGMTALHLATKNRYQKIVEALLQYNADINTSDNYGRTALHFSATYDMLGFPLCYLDEPDIKITGEMTKLLLSNGANVNAKAENGQTTLHFAAEKGYVQIIEVLLQYNVDVNAGDNFGRTALHIAAINDFHSFLHLNASIKSNILNIKAEMTRLLLSKGANVNAQTYNGLTALHAAVAGGYLKVVEALLEYDADIFSINGKTALQFIISKESEDFIRHCVVYDDDNDVKAGIAEMLLHKGADVNAQTRDGFTLLHAATEKGCLKLIKVLLEHGADVDICDINNKTALHYIVMNQNEDLFYNISIKHDDIDVKAEIAKLLLSKGANVDARANNHVTALYIAAQKGYTKIVETLLENNANVNCRMLQNLTPLHVAASEGFQDIIKILLKFRADINSRDLDGNTALHYATQSNELSIVKYLLECNADVDCGTINGYTPLHIAAECGFLEIIEILLEFDANINFRDINGKTAFHIATHKGHIQIVQSFLKNNADVNCRLPNGYTPLHIAAENGFLDIVEILLEFDADINFRDIHGRTALFLASLKNYYGVVTTLLEYGSDFNFISIHDRIILIPESSDQNIDFYSSLDAEATQITNVLSEEVFEAYKREAIKLKLANLHINERTLESLTSGNMDNIIAYCKKEIADMKSEKIANSTISFYDILIKSTTLLARCMRNKLIEEVLKSNSYKTKFPLFAKRIKQNIRRAMHKKEIQEKGTEFFHFLFNKSPELPLDCIEKIVNYWNKVDIKTLVDACNSNAEFQPSLARNSDS